MRDEFLTRFLFSPVWTDMLRERMVKEFAPIIVNWVVSDDLIASIAVRMPTRAIIPNAIIQIVSIALTLFDFIALNEILRFSRNTPAFIKVTVNDIATFKKDDKCTLFLSNKSCGCQKLHRDA